MFFMKNAVYLTGDTHGRFERIALFCRRQKLAAGDALIILGDAGLNYFGDWRDEDKKKYLSLLPCTIFCIHGNHEQRPSPEMGYQIDMYHGGKVWVEPKYPNIVFAIDGEVYDFCGHSCLVIGGAYSVDKWYRLAMGANWWPDEQPDDDAKQRAQAALDAREGELIVGIINYDLGSRNGQEREQGLRERLAQEARVGEIYPLNVLAEEDDAREKTMALLQAHPEINVVVGFNEPTAVGAAQAVEALALGETVDVVGFDSNVKTVDLMQTGVVSALIVQNPYAMGYLGVEAACDILGGESFDPEQLVDTATQIVTQENMFSLEGQKALFPFDTP